MRLHTAILVLPLLLTGACSGQQVAQPLQQGAAASSPPIPPPPAAHAPLAPFILRLSGPGAVPAGAEVEATARISRQGMLRAPIDLRVHADEGLVLIAGRVDERIDDVSSDEIVRSYKLRVLDPDARLEVRASMSGQGFGATAVKKLTFNGGPTEPQGPIPSPGALVQPR